METTITGKTLLARLQFLDDQLGRTAAERVLSKLPAEDRKVLGGIILPVGRYPLVLNARLDTAIAEALDPQNPRRIYRALGRRSAELNFTLIEQTPDEQAQREVRARRIHASRETLGKDSTWTSSTDTVFDGTYRFMLRAAKEMQP